MMEAEKAARWRRLVAEQEASGLSMAAFCAGRGLERQRFYNWRSTLKRRDERRQELPGFVRVVTAQVPVSAAPAPGVRLHIDQMGTFELDAGFDAATFAKALAVVRKVAE